MSYTTVLEVAELCVCVCAVLEQYPESCDCIQTDVECVEVNLQDVPLLSPNVTWL